ALPIYLPHGTGPETYNEWETSKFFENTKAVTNIKPRDVNFIAAGDMNEVGANQMFNDIPDISENYGSFKMSDGLPSCCSDSGYGNKFDRVVANRSAKIQSSEIIKYAYPIGRHGPDDEEHKAIYVTLTF
ncbi:MAG: hypothetical protein AAF512_26510, partial [Pseudomonadota bacterium]